MITIKLVRKVTMNEVDAMLEWLRIHCKYTYSFTGQGMELLTFEHDEDAMLFKLRFGI